MYNKDTKINNQGLTWSDGDLYNADKRMVSDYININDINSVYCNYYFYIFFYDENKNYLGNSSNLRKFTGEAYTNITIPSNEDIKYFRLVFAPTINNDKDMTNVEDIMVTRTQAQLTPYVAHQHQTFTFPLGNEKLMLGDYLADDGIHHVRKEIRLNSEIDFAMDSTGNGFNRFVAKCNDMKSGANNPMLSNYFTQVLNSDTEPTTRNKECMASSSGLNYKIMLVLNATNFPNKTTLYEWLSNNNVKLQYMLEEEVIVPYTSAQQKIYNEIKNAYSYDEMTIITGSSDGNKPFFTVQAYKDLNKELNNKVDKVQGKELSSNDFTDTLKEKLEGLENYDDTEIKADISDIQEEQVEQNTEIEKLQTENERLKATLPTTTGEGQDVTLDKTAEMEFVKPPLPRGNTKQDTTTGKNLLNTSNANTTTINGVTSYRNNGFYYLSGTNTKTDATWILPNTQNTNLPTFEIGQTYTMSFKGTLPSGIYAQLNGVKTSTGKQYSLGSVMRTVPYITFTIDSDYSSTAQLFVGIQGATTNADCNFAIQIEKGSTATPYEPYTGGIPSPNPGYPQEVEVVTGNVEVTISNENNTESKTLPVSLGNIELCKLGDYQDYLYKNNGKWYKYNAINKLVLNGSENWAAHGSIASWFYWDGITNGFTDNTISGYALSNYFTQKAYSTVTSLKNGEFAYGQVAGETRKRFVLKDTDYTTVADFKSWLSTHNTIVYYVLATPTDTEITDTTLISQLEAINNAISYEEQTNISNNTIALFNVEAYQSTKLVLQESNAKYESLEARVALLE